MTDALAWAREVQPARPLSLAEMEAEVLRRPMPDRARAGSGATAVSGGAAVLVGVLVAALVAAPLVGPAIVLAHASGIDRTVTEDLLPAARIAFVLTAALPQGVLAIWWGSRGRHRRWWDLPLVSGIALLSGASLLAALATGGIDVGFLVWMAVATVAATGVLVAILVASKPGPPPARAKVDDGDKRRMQVRAQVRLVLLERGLVDERDLSIAERELPPGGWAGFDRIG